MLKGISGFFPKKIFHVKTIISFALFAILFLHLVSFIPNLRSSIKDYQQAKRVFFLNDVSDDLYTAVGNYGFERGRVNVVLNDAGPVEGMEENRQFILDRRAEGDKALANALAKLSEVQQTDIIRNAIDQINQFVPEVVKLRKETDPGLELPKAERRQALPETWFSMMTAYIHRIESLLVSISNEISDADGIISRYSSLKYETLALRNTAGPEMSILSATMLSAVPLSPKSANKIKDLQIRTEGHFRNLSYLCQPLADSQIPQAFEALKKSYYDDYLPFRNIIYPLALEGGPYPYSQPVFLNHGVKALLQIATFMENIVAVTKNYSENKLRESRRQIILRVSSSAGSLLLILLIFLFVNYRIIKPISQVTSSILRLAEKDLSVQVPKQDYQNEIGEMARAVEVFKGMALQLNENVVILEESSKEREQLIAKLQATLDEIKILRGILPICSYCKKIRNDDGYFEQIESYIHSHSGVDFSHTICPSCMKKYYPEEVE